VARMHVLHSWDVDAEEAVRIQEALKDRLVQQWHGRSVRTVAGIDVSVRAGHSSAAVVVLDMPSLHLLETAVADLPVHFPYIPGLLAFREGPVVLKAWERLPGRPDLVLCDGHGLAHPRGIGMASHLGLWFECPTVGVGKSLLCGQYREPGRARGDCSSLYREGAFPSEIGMMLRTRHDVKPVVVSVGHLIDLRRAVEFVLRCSPRYRIPEPLRLAHLAAGEAASHGVA
jgi:deoxyribonuclease V